MMFPDAPTSSYSDVHMPCIVDVEYSSNFLSDKTYHGDVLNMSEIVLADWPVCTVVKVDFPGSYLL